MTEINVESIEQAITKFYHSSEDRQSAHAILSSIQGSQSAWQFCWVLLSEDKSQEVQFFGAATLQIKILKYWFEFPTDMIGQLQNQLLEKILLFGGSAGGKLVANKLCSAMSALVLHTIQEEWPDAVTQIISIFQSCETITAEVRCKLLLEVLTCVADQFHFANFGVRTAGRRAAVHLVIMQQFDQISTLLSSLLDAQVPTAVQESALRCTSSWIEFGVKLDQLGVLINKAFVCLRNTDVFEAAVDTLIAALTKNHPDHFPATLEVYFAEVVKLLPLWQTALNEENMEWCRDISRLVINFAEENVSLLAKLVTGNRDQQNLCMSVISMIMTFTDIKGSFPVDESLSDLAFGFWYMLQDMILSTSDNTYVELYMRIFSPIYLSLIHVLLRKVQYPEDSVYNSMNAEEREQFRCYRQDIADTIMFANCMLREGVLLLLKSYIANLSQALPNVRWQEVEALLYILSNVTEDSLPTDEEEWEVSEDSTKLTRTTNNMLDDIMIDAVNLISKLKIGNKILLISILQVIGAFSDQYGQKPEVLGIVFPVILLHGLNNPDTVLFATTALKDICKDNRSSMGPYADGILNVCHHKLLEGALSPRNSARLLSCVGHVLSTLSQSRIFEWLNKFLPPITDSLNQAASSNPSAAVKHLILDKLQLLTFLSDSLDVKRPESQAAVTATATASTDTQPVLVIMKDLLPVLKSILANWVTDVDIVACVVELIKKSLHTLLNDFIEILNEVSLLLVNMYEHLQHPTILEIIKQLILMFMKDANTFEVVKNAFHSVAHKTVDILHKDPHNQTDLLESYLTLCVQMSKKSAIVLIDDHFPFDSTFEIAVIGVSLPEALTMKASCSFLTDVISKKATYIKVDTIIPKLCVQLYDIMLKSIGGAAPRTNMDYMTGIFLAMNVSYFPLASSTLQLLLSQENYPVPFPTATDKARFIKDVLRERNNKRRLKDTIATFSMVCRGIAGTEYALQTTYTQQFR